MVEVHISLLNNGLEFLIQPGVIDFLIEEFNPFKCNVNIKAGCALLLRYWPSVYLVTENVFSSFIIALI